ncbi:MAG: hypothetical protein HKO65_12355, partial [Gemmatimonadetes bacterium]|nr:hypothetical protein [Gemmatimonadota bacterium]
ALAGLGKKAEAIAAAERALELMPESRDAFKAMYRWDDLARVLTIVGEYDRATEVLERILSRPGRLSVQLLRLDPAWAPLRGHPGFQALLESPTE